MKQQKQNHKQKQKQQQKQQQQQKQKQKHNNTIVFGNHKKQNHIQFSGITCLEIGLRLLNEENIAECKPYIEPLFQINQKYILNVFRLSISLTRYSSFLYLMEDEETNYCSELFLNAYIDKLVEIAIKHITAFLLIQQEENYYLIYLKGKEFRFLLVEPYTQRNKNEIKFTYYEFSDQLMGSLIEKVRITKDLQTHFSIYIRKDRYYDQSLSGKMKGDWELKNIDAQQTNLELKLHKKFSKLFGLNDKLRRQYSSNNEIIYNYKKKNENLKTAISKFEKKIKQLSRVQCNICCQSYHKSQMIILNCNHKTCKNCLKNYIKFSINNARLPIKCTQHKCDHEIESKIFKSMNLDQNLIDKYEKFTLQKYLNKHNSELIICPNPKCQLESAIEGNAFFFVCPYCKIVYCPKCKTYPYHTYETCLEYKNRIIKEKSEKRQRKLINEKNNKASELWKKKNTRKCLGCQANVEKNKGCNHMKCTQCNTHFCYECGKIISQNEKNLLVIHRRVENHYKNSKCVFFTEKMIKK
ncbi:rbr-type e3 ubiquitin transferase [Anaeramoeba flamelloides]|uniref:RBR-type E3 ubiquitin transferase n=1 Tax=Anaeramoeba flamelloides TaxID=1746091 RepID=A0AAV7ZN65_9EUKA|nr:rbr-type e3 ubiquitin transferase [Anaeramoeba flamelloides]